MKEEEESCCCQRCNRSRRSLLLRSPGERSDWIFDGTHTRLASLSPLHIPHSHILRDICPPIHFLVVYYKSAQGFPWKQSAKAKNLIKNFFFFFSFRLLLLDLPFSLTDSLSTSTSSQLVHSDVERSSSSEDDWCCRWWWWWGCRCCCCRCCWRSCCWTTGRLRSAAGPCPSPRCPRL